MRVAPPLLPYDDSRNDDTMTCDPASADCATAGPPDGRDERAQRREQLRRQMRALRGRLSQRERAEAARGLARVLLRSRLLQSGKHIAVYLKQGSEADLCEIIELARRRGCQLYLPVVTSYRNRRMRFMRFDAATPLRPNRYGILEPRPAYPVPLAVRHLDVVLVPLVAVDAQGWRLGSGAGYYDRCLHHLALSRVRHPGSPLSADSALPSGRHAGAAPRWRRPRLVGVCYEFQRVPRLDPQPWDVPLDAVVTERGFYRSRRTSPPETRLPANPGVRAHKVAVHSVASDPCSTG